MRCRESDAQAFDPEVDSSVMSGVWQRDKRRALRTAWVGQCGQGDAAEFVGEVPTGAQADQDSTGADRDFGGGFDQPLTPRAGEAFAQRIVASPPTEPGSALPAGERFGREAAIQVIHGNRDRLCAVARRTRTSRFNDAPMLPSSSIAHRPRDWTLRSAPPTLVTVLAIRKL